MINKALRDSKSFISRRRTRNQPICDSKSPAREMEGLSDVTKTSDGKECSILDSAQVASRKSRNHTPKFVGTVHSITGFFSKQDRFVG